MPEMSKKAMGKEKRRHAQAKRVEEKNKENIEYFQRCCEEEQRNRENGCYKKPSEATKEELFRRQSTSGINFAEYQKIQVSRSGPEGCDSIPDMRSFSDLKSVLPKFLFENLTKSDRLAYDTPTPIQKHCIPISLEKTFDVMACAQTGSGKTVAFLVPLVTRIMAALITVRRSRRSMTPVAASPLAIVVSPTRELALQIELEAHKLTYSSPIQCVCVYGGSSSQQQLALLAKGVDILIATPGRLNDFLSQGVITLRQTKFCVLDEADRMLDMGFEPQIREICERYDLPVASERNTLMFSATFPVEVQKIARTYMRPYVFVAVGRVGSTVESISQRIVPVNINDKKLKLDTIIPLINPSDKTIIFCQRKRLATWLKNQLLKSQLGVRVDAIHGDRSQSQREHALELFRDDKLDILVATDVAARGLDVPGINHVIQFDLPVSYQDFDSYVHRIGRTGRAGRLGRATALYVPGKSAKLGQNDALLKPLCNLLREGKQDVPAWLSVLSNGQSSNENVTIPIDSRHEMKCTDKFAVNDRDNRRKLPAGAIVRSGTAPVVLSQVSNVEKRVLHEPYQPTTAENHVKLHYSEGTSEINQKRLNTQTKRQLKKDITRSKSESVQYSIDRASKNSRSKKSGGSALKKADMVDNSPSRNKSISQNIVGRKAGGNDDHHSFTSKPPREHSFSGAKETSYNDEASTKYQLKNVNGQKNRSQNKTATNRIAQPSKHQQSLPSNGTKSARDDSGNKEKELLNASSFESGNENRTTKKNAKEEKTASGHRGLQITNGSEAEVSQSCKSVTKSGNNDLNPVADGKVLGNVDRNKRNKNRAKKRRGRNDNNV